MPFLKATVSRTSILSAFVVVVLVSSAFGTSIGAEQKRVVVDAANAAELGCKVEILYLYTTMHAVQIELEGRLADELARADLLYAENGRSMIQSSIVPIAKDGNRIRLSFNADPSVIPKMQVFLASNRDGHGYCTIQLSSFFQHSPDSRVTSARLANRFPLSKLKSLFGLSDKFRIQQYSEFDKGTPAAASLYLVNADENHPQNPVVIVRVGKRGTYFKPPHRKGRLSYQLNRVGTMSYARDFENEKGEAFASELVFISSDNSWECSLVSDLKKSNLANLNTLATELDNFLSGLPDIYEKLQEAKNNVKDFGLWIVPPKGSRYKKLRLVVDREVQVGDKDGVVGEDVAVTEKQATEIIDRLHCGGFYSYARYQSELVGSRRTSSSLLSTAGGMIAIEGRDGSIEFFNGDWSQRGDRWLRRIRSNLEGQAASRIDELIAEWKKT
jgi:hypothetical protein